MMDAAITIRRGNRLYGPYSVEEITRLLDAGSVILQDEARAANGEKWTTLLRILALSPAPQESNEDEIELTAADVLGDLPATDPAAERACAQRRDRVANILAVVGLIAIALGTLDIALHMKRSAKSPASQAVSPTRRSPDTLNLTREAEEAEKSKPHQ